MMTPLFPFEPLLAGALICLQTLLLFLNIFGLPANWLILGMAVLWRVTFADPAMDLFFWIIMAGLAIGGEVVELALLARGGRKYGSSSSGTIMAMIGAIAGAILLAPLFWGLGAFIGALCGCWLGCFITELIRGTDTHAALRAALGAVLGRFLGTVAKIAIGAVMIAFTARAIWPETQELPYLPADEYETLAISLLHATLYHCGCSV